MSALDVAVHPASAGLVALHRDAMGRIVRTATLAFVLALVPAGTWLAFAPLASGIAVEGVVTVDLHRRPVQHAEGGLVAEVRVRNGQRVRRGDPLLVLGDVAVSADADRLALRMRAEEAALARLLSEQAARASVVFPDALLEAARDDVRVRALLDNERAAFTARRETWLAQSALLRAQRARIADELASLDAQIGEARRSLALQREEAAAYSALQRDGFVSATRLTTLQAGLADYGVKLAERESEKARAEQRRIETELKLQSLDAEYRHRTTDVVKAAVQRIEELREEGRKSADASARQVIVAPVDGEIIDLRHPAPGALIGPRETVAEIVPDAPRLLVEARVRPEDIAQVHPGQSADVRFTAFDPRSTPVVTGRVAYVSADRLSDPRTQAAYYAAQVELAPGALQDAGVPPLQAGMPAEVFVRGRDRTALQYLTQPVTDVLRRGAREP